MTQPPILEARGLSVGYGGRPVLTDINFTLDRSEVLCLIGHNGAGKSTLIKALCGLIPSQHGQVLVDGQVVNDGSPKDIWSQGLALVPEGRGVFPSLSVKEIFALGLWASHVSKAGRQQRIDEVLELLPAVKGFYTRRAGSLSGGQQQMVSIGRALLTRPRCLLMDEPSIGLAPKLFHDLLTLIRSLQQSLGLSILLVEQNVKEALKVSDRVIVIKSGEIIRRAVPAELSDNASLVALF